MPAELRIYSEKIGEGFIWNGERWVLATEPYKFWKTPQECARLRAERPPMPDGARKTLEETLGRDADTVHWNGRSWALGDECMGEYGDDRILKELGCGPQAEGRMTRRRKLIVWVWIGFVVALGMYPPWFGRNDVHLGYGLIFAPPQRFGRVDQSLLSLEWILVTVVATGLFLAWPFGKKKP
jgi:hypothetical protein